MATPHSTGSSQDQKVNLVATELHGDEIDFTPLRALVTKHLTAPPSLRREDLYALDIVELETRILELEHDKALLRDMLGMALDAVNHLQNSRRPR